MIKTSIQALDRAFSIINCFTLEVPALSLNQISELLELNVNTVRGILNSLIAYDYIEYSNETRTFSIGLGFMAKYDLLQQLRINHLIDLIAPHQNDLANRHLVSCTFTMFSNGKMRVVSTASPQKSHFYIGTPRGNVLTPFSASSKLSMTYSSGWMRKKIIQSYEEFIHMELSGDFTLLTYLQEEEIPSIIVNGYAVETPIFVPDITSYAVPIFAQNKKLIGSISVSHTERALNAIKDVVISDLINIAQNISTAIML